MPTMKEQGYEVVWGSARMIAVPAGVSMDIQKNLGAAVEKTANDPKWKKWLDKNGGGWIFMNAKQTQVYVKSTQDKIFPLLDAHVAKGLIKKKK